jgi:hypothetical protein
MVQDLSPKNRNVLVPTSQEAGGMIYNNSAAMTAPGSTPITPMKTPYGADIPFGEPDQLDQDGPKVAKSNNAGRVTDNPAPRPQDSAGGWVNTDDMPDAGGWRRV